MNLTLIFKSLAITETRRVIILWRRVTLCVETGVRIYCGVTYRCGCLNSKLFLLLYVFLEYHEVKSSIITAQKMKFSIKGFFSKCDLRIWSQLLKKSLMENFIFQAVIIASRLIPVRLIVNFSLIIALVFFNSRIVFLEKI